MGVVLDDFLLIVLIRAMLPVVELKFCKPRIGDALGVLNCYFDAMA